MSWIRGYYRLFFCGLTLGMAGWLIIMASWLPGRIKDIRLSMWVTQGVVRLVLLILNVRVHCSEPEKVQRHEGFVFGNHVSYLDILTLVSVTPVRFLAKEEVRTMPIIGRIAQAIGCVFVKREDKKSRAEAREALAQVDRFPPVVLFVEGKRGPGHELLPFRYGAFEIVTQGSAPFLPCVIRYDRPEVAIWHRSENIMNALWRLARRSGPIRAEIIPLAVVEPTPADDPVQLSLATHAEMTAVWQQWPLEHARTG